MKPRYIPVCFILGFAMKCIFAQLNSQRLQPFQQLRRSTMVFRERLAIHRQMRGPERSEICYDVVGCFQVSRKHSPLTKVPQPPDIINTKFFLYKRENFGKAQEIKYNDNKESLKNSNFSFNLPVKILIHGYKGSGSDEGAMFGISEFLKLMDVNLIFVDWTKGAAGPSYPIAVANTELVGRQLAVLLFDLLTMGVPQKHIHIIGFSLGAHIAACASHVLQTKNIKIGRITGLDPASPIYKSNRFLEASRKLDKEDAHFVDVVHTDGSPIWTNGFGLLQPLGHVDFFPNGGTEQPGCNDGRASLVVSHFEGTVNSSTVCSHARAWRLFVESLTQRDGGCKFIAYPCPGGHNRFNEGSCFPNAETCSANECSYMGISADQKPARGPLFLVTRDTYPYCGDQLRAKIVISEKTPRTRGIVLMNLKHGSSSTNFRMHYEFPDIIQGGRTMWGLAAAEFGTIDIKRNPNITATLSYQSLAFQDPGKSKNDEETQSNDDLVFIDRVTLSDINGNTWYYCNKETMLEESMTSAYGLKIMLSSRSCRNR